MVQLSHISFWLLLKVIICLVLIVFLNIFVELKVEKYKHNPYTPLGAMAAEVITYTAVIR